MIVLSQKITPAMSALYILIGVSLIVAAGFLGAFLWAMKKGQYDDDYTPSVRMLFENTFIPPEAPEQPLKKELINKTLKK
jgi:cbb3-type cytochrome oxidase maturation protein